MVLKRFRIVTHCYAASFFIKTLFCKTNNISTARKPNIRQKQIIILKVHHGGKFSKFCLRQQLFAFKRFCIETRLLNISKTTNVIDFIKTILKSPCRFLLDNAIWRPQPSPFFAKGCWVLSTIWYLICYNFCYILRKIAKLYFLEASH